jgi:hypothetical protein
MSLENGYDDEDNHEADAEQGKVGVPDDPQPARQLGRDEFNGRKMPVAPFRPCQQTERKARYDGRRPSFAYSLIQRMHYPSNGLVSDEHESAHRQRIEHKAGPDYQPAFQTLRHVADAGQIIMLPIWAMQQRQAIAGDLNA